MAFARYSLRLLFVFVTLAALLFGAWVWLHPPPKRESTVHFSHFLRTDGKTGFEVIINSRIGDQGTTIAVWDEEPYAIADRVGWSGEQDTRFVVEGADIGNNPTFARYYENLWAYADREKKVSALPVAKLGIDKSLKHGIANVALPPEIANDFLKALAVWESQGKRYRVAD